MKFKVNVNFQGVALIEVEAKNVAEAVRMVDDLTMADLARPGHTDIIQLKLAAREAVPLQDQAEDADEAAPGKKRPSGWYRPA
jgi:hypothetical protein